VKRGVCASAASEQSVEHGGWKDTRCLASEVHGQTTKARCVSRAKLHGANTQIIPRSRDTLSTRFPRSLSTFRYLDDCTCAERIALL
jgi:hypothetical protein